MQIDLTKQKIYLIDYKNREVYEWGIIADQNSPQTKRYELILAGLKSTKEDVEKRYLNDSESS